MNCPHCEKELPENYDAGWCPYCGKELIPAREPGTPHRRKIRWRVFFIVLFTPVLLTLFSVLLSVQRSSIPTAFAFAGSAVSGIICGGMIGHGIGRTTVGRIGFGIFFVAVFVVVALCLNCFGCLAGGYQAAF